MKTNSDKRKPTTIFIEPQLYKQMRIMALELDKTVSDCIEEAFKEYIEKSPKKK